MLTLSCANCGAGLQIDEPHAPIKCIYCHSMQAVEQDGGEFLLKIIDKLDSVEINSKRTAAELALPRLKAELIEAQNQRYSLLSKHQKTADKKEDTAIARIILPPLVGFLASCVVGYLFKASDTIFLLLIAGGSGYGIFKSIKAYRSTKWTMQPIPSIVAELDSRISTLESEIARLRKLLIYPFSST